MGDAPKMPILETEISANNGFNPSSWGVYWQYVVYISVSAEWYRFLLIQVVDLLDRETTFTGAHLPRYPDPQFIRREKVTFHPELWHTMAPLTLCSYADNQAGSRYQGILDMIT